MKFTIAFLLFIIPYSIFSQDLSGCVFNEEGATDFYSSTNFQDVPDLVYEHALNTFYSFYSENFDFHNILSSRVKMSKEEAKEWIKYLGQIKDPFKRINIYHFNNGFLAGNTVPFLYNKDNDAILNPIKLSRNVDDATGFNNAFVFLLNELIVLENLQVNEVVLIDLFNILALYYSLEGFYRINGNENLNCLTDFREIEIDNKITSQLKEPSFERSKDQVSYTAQILFGQKKLYSFTLTYDFKDGRLRSTSKYIGDIYN